MDTNINNKCKAFTTLKQSKKLMEILPIESADMEYILEQWVDEKTHRRRQGYCEIPVVKVEDDCPIQPITLPCWSLAALLEVMPHPDIFRNLEGTWILSTLDFPKIRGGYDNLVDACVNMILMIHECKMS